MKIIKVKEVRVGSLFLDQKPVDVPQEGFRTPWDVVLYKENSQISFKSFRGNKVPWLQVQWSNGETELYSKSILLKNVSRELIQEQNLIDQVIELDGNSYSLQLPQVVGEQDQPSRWEMLVDYFYGDKGNKLCWKETFFFGEGSSPQGLVPFCGYSFPKNYYYDYAYYTSFIVGWRPVLRKLEEEQAEK